VTRTDLPPDDDGPCDGCDGIAWFTAECCPEPEPCQYRGIRIPCDECNPDGKLPDLVPSPAAEAAQTEKERT